MRRKSSEALKAVAPAPVAAPPRIEHKIVLVTPELATEYLNANTANRAVVQAVVERYAADMRRGVWRLNGETIKFGTGPDGGPVLFDGQHRLWAVIESGASVWMEIVTGLLPECRPTIDVGVVRKTGDALVMFENNPHGRLDASLVQMIHLLLTKSTDRLSFDATKDACSTFGGGLAFVHGLGKVDRTLGKIPILSAFVLAHARAGNALGEFVTRYFSGVGLEANDPEHLLREFVIKRYPLLKEDRRGLALKTLRAILMSVRGEKLRRLEIGNEAVTFFVSGYPSLRVVEP